MWNLLERLGRGDWRLAVVRAQLIASVGLYFALTLLVLVLRGPDASALLMLVAGVFSLLLLLVLQARPRWRPGVVSVDILGLVVVMLGLELVSSGPLLSVWATLAIVPMIGTLLAGHRYTGVMLGMSAVSLLVLGASYGTAELIDAIAAIGVAAFVAGISWIAEQARVQAEALAQTREAALAQRAQEATAANEAKSTFLAIISHEIRTPMNGVLGVTRALLDTPLSEEQRSLASTVLSSGQSLMIVLNDVLDLSRLEADRMPIEAVPLQPAQLLDETRALLAPLAEEKGLGLRCVVRPEVPAWVEGDPTRLRQILFNLLGNAVKFTSTGRIEARMAYRDGALQIEIEDTGIGISEAQLATLFEAFTQADSSTTRRYGGSGLGLAICRQLCARMGGQLQVRSSPGVGSTFWFALPAPPCPPPARMPQRAEVGLRAGARVLLAEDHPVNQLVARRILEKLGLDVLVVDNGQQAVEQLQQDRWDLVLMDCYMPVMDGFEATRAIRALPGGPARTPILALTASATSQDRQRVLEAGMNDLLPKPLDPEQLQRVMAQWLPTDA